MFMVVARSVWSVLPEVQVADLSLPIDICDELKRGETGCLRAMSSPRNARILASPRKLGAASSTSSAIELPIINLSRFASRTDEEADISSPSPSPPLPSTLNLLDSRHDQLVMRRQPSRPRDGGGAKRYPGHSARFENLRNVVLDDLEFSGWGTSSKLDEADLDLRAHDSEAPTTPKFGSWTATGIAGNAVLGSVFYAFPAVVKVAGVYSPISLLIACLVIFLYRPCVEQLRVGPALLKSSLVTQCYG